GRRQAVPEQVLEQELAETATRLRGAQGLLETREIFCALEHLRRRLVHLAEPLVDLVRRLRCVLEPAVDLRVELREPSVHRLGHPDEMPIDLGVAVRQLGAPVGTELAEGPSEPDERGREAHAEKKDEEYRC